MIVFEYIFYRIAKYFYKKDGLDAPRAIGFLTLIQVYLFMIVFAPIFWSLTSFEQTAPYAKTMGKVGAVIGLIWLLINYRIYKGKYWKLAEKWRGKETPSQLRWRGIAIVLAILFPFWFIFVLLFVDAFI